MLLSLCALICSTGGSIACRMRERNSRYSTSKSARPSSPSCPPAAAAPLCARAMCPSALCMSAANLRRGATSDSERGLGGVRGVVVGVSEGAAAAGVIGARVEAAVEDGDAAEAEAGEGEAASAAPGPAAAAARIHTA